MARDDDLRRPVAGLGFEQPEFHGQKAGILPRQVDIGVDAPDKRSDDVLAVGVVMSQLFFQVAPEPEEPRADVPPDRLRPEPFGHRPGGLPPPQFQLEEPVRGGVKPLGKKKIALAAGADMGDPPFVTDDLHGLLKAPDGDDLRPVRLLETSGRARDGRGQCQGRKKRRPLFCFHDQENIPPRGACQTAPRSAPSAGPPDWMGQLGGE